VQCDWLAQGAIAGDARDLELLAVGGQALEEHKLRTPHERSAAQSQADCLGYGGKERDVVGRGAVPQMAGVEPLIPSLPSSPDRDTMSSKTLEPPSRGRWHVFTAQRKR
jgi:hypothetical protein